MCIYIYIYIYYVYIISLDTGGRRLASTLGPCEPIARPRAVSSEAP